MTAQTSTPPSLFQIELTNVCNIDCSMCARSSGLSRPIEHMYINLFRKIVLEASTLKMPIHWLHHFGETLAYPHLEEALVFFKEHGYGPGAVSTNVILLNDEKIEILLNNCSYILCCIDSMDPEAYVKIRVNKHFEKVKTNIEKLIRRHRETGSKAKIAIQFLRTQHNRNEDIIDMIEYFGNHSNVKYIEKRTDKHPKGADITLVDWEDVALQKTHCSKIRSELCVLASGECTACCWDADGEMIIGDVRTQSLSDIWQGQTHKMMQLRLRMGAFGELPLCEKCTGPVTDPDFGVVEQVNAWADEWRQANLRVALAPASQANLRLLRKTRLRNNIITALFDADPDTERDLSGLPEPCPPILGYDSVTEVRPDIVLIYSPRFSSEIYFQLRHLRQQGIRLVVLGGHLD